MSRYNQVSEVKTREELEGELKAAEDELDEVDDTPAPHAHPHRGPRGLPCNAHLTNFVRSAVPGSAGVRMAVLGQTGVHIGARELQKHNARIDSDQKRLTERIEQIKRELAALESGK